MRNLNIKISADEDFYVARDLSFSIEKNEIVGILGESGSGKSLLAKSICGLIAPPVRMTGGIVEFDGKTLQNEKDFKSIRGNGVAMIFQHPASALNPVMTIGEQLTETILFRKTAPNKASAREFAINLLADTGIEYPADRLNAYPHQLSGGMNQRVMIALALSTKPKLLMADEPTTALDVIIQAQIIDLLAKLSREKDFGTMFITHDISLAEKIADRVLVMYAGEIIEILTGKELATGLTRHPCTSALKKCLPHFANRGTPLFSIQGKIPHNTSQYDNACIFYERCEYAQKRCKTEKPTIQNGVKCFYPMQSH